jgi:hypothetical protein
MIGGPRRRRDVVMESTSSSQKVHPPADAVASTRPRWLVPVTVAGVAGIVAAGSLALARVGNTRRAEDALTAHAPPSARRIEITADALEALSREQARQAGVPPSADGKALALRDYVDRELLYREATALDLGRDDVIVKRRLVQKMEALLEAAVPSTPPTDAEVSAWFWAHTAALERPARVSFTHVFFRRDRIDGDLEHVAAEAIASLEDGAAPGSMGDPFVRGSSFASRSKDELAGLFGADFADRVIEAPEKHWSGPIASSYGWHLVRIDGREGARLPDLDEVRPRIVAQLALERRERTRRETLDRLRSQYEIVTPP